MSNTKAIKEEKRKKAEARQANYDKLSLEEKLARAGAKEKAKLVVKTQK